MEWSKLGVSAADRIDTELTGYDFQLKPHNNTQCYCKSCIHGKKYYFETIYKVNEVIFQ